MCISVVIFHVTLIVLKHEQVMETAQKVGLRTSSTIMICSATLIDLTTGNSSSQTMLEYLVKLIGYCVNYGHQLPVFNSFCYYVKGVL